MRDDRGHDHLLYLDGLRAVAVLSVVVFHVWQYSGAGGPPLAARLFQMGAHGVDLFFVLSGFCLAYPYLRRFRERGTAEFVIASFAAKRITRIVPPYWIALLLVVGLGLLHVFGQPPVWTDSLKQMFFLDRDVQYVAGPFWTLPVEFRWYFLFPGVLIAYARAPRFVLALAVGSYVLYDFARMSDTPDFGTLPAFLAGIWAADMFLTRSALQRFALPTFLLYGCIAFVFEPDRLHSFYAVEPLGVGSILALVVFAGAFAPLRKTLSHPALTRVGAGAYGIYLLHDPILKQLQTVDRVSPWLAGVAAVALSFGFSWICERPFVTGPMRDTMVGFLEVRCAAIIAALGIPGVLQLAASHNAAAHAIELPADTSTNAEVTKTKLAA